MHLDPEQLERLLHAELDPAQESRLRAHVAECAYCERRLDHARDEEREIHALLRAVDHPVPRANLGDVVARASTGGRYGFRIAAGVVLALVGAGALYALPGASLPRLVQQAREWLAADPVALPTTPPYASGIAVAVGAELEVHFARMQTRGVATIRLVDSRELTVHAIGEPVRFELDVDRLTVANQDVEADYEILIPRDARRVRVRIGSEVALRMEQGRIESAVQPDPSGTYHLPMDSATSR